MSEPTTIQFSPSPKQYEAWELLTDNKTTEIGYGGGAGGGKSYLGCVFTIAQCLAYPGIAIGIGRKELINLRRTTLLTFFKVAEEFNVTHAFKYNQQTNIISFTNGSQVMLVDMAYSPQDPMFTRFGGFELTHFFSDESNESPVKAIELIKTRLGRRMNREYGLTPKLLETFNPDKGHVYQDYYKPWKDNQLPEYRAFVKALVTDNPHIDPNYIQQLERSDKITKERLLYGNFEYDDDPLALIERDAIMDLFTNTVLEGTERFISADIARFGMDKVVEYVWLGMKLKVIKVKGKQGTEVTAGDLRSLSQTYDVPYSRIIVDEDGIGGGVVDQMHGIKGFTGNARVFNEENYQNARTQCYYKLAEMINSRQIAIECDDVEIRSKIIEELEQVKAKDVDKDNKRRILSKEEVKERLGRSPDFADALMMRMWFTYNTGTKKVHSNMNTVVMPINRGFNIKR